MFSDHKNNLDKKKPGKKTGVFVILTIITNVFLILIALFKPHKWVKFIKGSKREIEELSTGQENFNRFSKDVGTLFADLFIPNERNDHKPRALRPKSLLWYAVIAVAVKVAVTGALFLSYPTPAQLSAIVSSRMVELANAARIEAGVEPLKVNQNLVNAASTKGEDMIARNYFAHDTPEGKRPWQWIDRSQYDYVVAGENLAMDFTSAEMVQAAFMKSPSHRKNILNPKYKETGMAVLHGSIDDRPTILLVQFFGTQRFDSTSQVATAEPVVQPAPSQPATAPAIAEVEPAAPVDALPEVAGEELVEPKVEVPAPVQGEAPLPFEVIATQEPIQQEVVVEDVPIQALPEFDTLNEGVIAVSVSQRPAYNTVDLLMRYSNAFFIAFLLFLMIAFVFNVVVKIRVQHSSVILQTLAVVVLIATMLLAKPHFAQEITSTLLIL